jgi:hypothetical protein
MIPVTTSWSYTLCRLERPWSLPFSNQVCRVALPTQYIIDKVSRTFFSEVCHAKLGVWDNVKSIEWTVQSKCVLSGDRMIRQEMSLCPWMGHLSRILQCWYV